MLQIRPATRVEMKEPTGFAVDDPVGFVDDDLLREELQPADFVLGGVGSQSTAPMAAAFKRANYPEVRCSSHTTVDCVDLRSHR
ncbi:hypothetical protein CH299_21705 [Rhodococcus sp. 14-2686-1-2]|nr:hypothetical protein CH301_21190 [Rhodococcus sp. 15-1189-1-1a]OZF10865.1 hypothetical protein CH299_21705 [Rhodococcus sp. 14-2686-1-2]